MKLAWTIVSAAVALALIELAIRAVGLIDFPLYDIDEKIGYLPRPNQKGAFLRNRDWEYNELSMGSATFRPTPGRDILLIGDSIVNGGNPTRQQDRLGPKLQELEGVSVWAVSAGSWSLLNELAYLGSHHDVVEAVDEIIFVLNSKDFGDASTWTSDLTHPLRRPTYATAYVIRKYIYDWTKLTRRPQVDDAPMADWKIELARLLEIESSRATKVTIVLFPTRSEMQSRSYAELELHACALTNAGAKRILSVGRDARWSAAYYRDNIHPTSEGNAVLAQIISRPMREAIVVDQSCPG